MFDLTPVLKLYSRIRQKTWSKSAPHDVQLRELLYLIRKASATRFGCDHGFNSIKSYRDFKEKVPLRRYEDFWNEYWSKEFPYVVNASWPGKIPCFAVTSGTTTGATKYIPHTAEMTRSNARAGLDLYVHHIINRPDSRIFGGKSFMLGGSTALVKEAEGIYSGDLSGIAVKTLPWWIKGRSFPPPNLALISDWEQKTDKLARESLKNDIRLFGGVPSWMLIFFEKLKELKSGSLADWYPNLELLVHGGVNFSPYRSVFAALLEGSKAETREVYPASEGFIAVQDKGAGEGLRMVLDSGIFYEFVPLEELESANPTRFWIGDVETGVNYALVLSNCAGMWGYVLGDTVKFVETNPPRILVTGRTSYTLSAFGEHLIGEEIEKGVSEAAAQCGLTVTDYSVGPLFPKDSSELGGHLFVAEFADGKLDDEKKRSFVKMLDEKLSAINDDYRAHRSNNFGLHEPKIITAAPGMFKEWMKARGKLGGQHKVPRIINDQKLLDNLSEFASQFTRTQG